MSSESIDRLVAANEITQSLLNYCRSMDRIDPELGYTVWHDDGLADYQMFQGTGRAFIDWVCEIHRKLIAHTHHITPPLIHVRGDEAASETYVTASLVGEREGLQVLSTYRGRYLDRWSKRKGRWAIDKRIFINDFGFTQPIDLTPIAAQLGASVRGSSDPSYALWNELR